MCNHKGRSLQNQTGSIISVSSRTLSRMEEVQAPTEQNLFGEEAVRLGHDWPTEHDDTSHMKCGYYRRDNGSLGKVVNGIKLSESEDYYK